jgi:CDP-paratose 2-epimerase
MKKILITGGCGFVGSSLALALKEDYPHYEVYVLDNLKRKGSELNVSRLSLQGIKFVHGDIRNKEDFDALPSINTIIDASAEPSVLAGINSAPDYLLNTNIIGTINCLNFAVRSSADLIFLSTSRVYPIHILEQLKFEEEENRFQLSNQQTIPGCSSKGISEDFPLKGVRSLYGTTKLASELIIEEYNHFYKLKTVINRCGVLTGSWQMGKVDQGVVVLWMAKHFWNQKLSYIGYGGEGKQVRDILHVQDLYRLIDYQLHNLDKVNGQTFNVGGGKEVSVSLKELTAICQRITGNKIAIDKISANREADIRMYITDNSRIEKLTGWKPEISVDRILEDIYLWIQQNHKDLEPILK